jgi:hypothetical protein
MKSRVLFLTVLLALGSAPFARAQESEHPCLDEYSPSRILTPPLFLLLRVIPTIEAEVAPKASVHVVPPSQPAILQPVVRLHSEGPRHVVEVGGSAARGADVRIEGGQVASGHYTGEARLGQVTAISGYLDVSGGALRLGGGQEVSLLAVNLGNAATLIAVARGAARFRSAEGEGTSMSFEPASGFVFLIPTSATVTPVRINVSGGAGVGVRNGEAEPSGSADVGVQVAF